MSRETQVIKKKGIEEVGDLFVTETSILVKLLPSRKVGSKVIRWFSNGLVTNNRTAAKDISTLIGKVRRKSSVVRGLTVMTDRGLRFDLGVSGLPEAVQKAGFEMLN